MIKPKKDLKIADVVRESTGDKWVYSNIVKDHFFHPRNLILKDPKKGEFDAEGQIGSPACGDIMKIWIKVDPKTERIKKLKWRTFGSLIASEKVLIENYSTISVDRLNEDMRVIDGNGKPNSIETIFKKKYRGRILSIRLSTSSYYTFSVTPVHPIPCVERNTVSKPKRKKGYRWSEVHDELVQKAKIITKAANELKPGDFLIFKPDNKVINDKEFTNEMCRILGYYVSDGCINSPNRVTFYFGLTENQYLQEVIAFARRRQIQFKISERHNYNVVDLRLHSKQLVNFLSIHGGLPNKKTFSKEVMKLPPQKQMLIIDAYLNGDGWATKQKEFWNEQYFISTSCENLANQLQTMLARNKIFAPIHKREQRRFTIRNKTYKNSGELNLIFQKKKDCSRIKYYKKEGCFLIPISKIVIRNYNGNIYDFGLKNTPKIYKLKGISFHNCASAIATTSIFSTMVTEKRGMKIDEALKIRPQDIMKRLGGLPARKVHCSVLADKAFRNTINNYFRKTGQHKRIIVEGAKIIDPTINLTDRDIEEAVLEGAITFEDLQKRLKVGIGNPESLPEIEQLLRFYQEKYYGP